MSLYVLPVPAFTNTFYGVLRDAVSLRNGQLGFREWQVLDLLNLIRGQFGVRPTAHVLLVCHRLQVLRVYATRVAAEVIEGHSHRNGADKFLVHEPMCEVVLTVDPESAVTSSGLPGNPNPAPGIRVDTVAGFERTAWSDLSLGDSVGAGLAASRAVRNGLATIKTGFGRMKGHVSLLADVPRRRVFLAPLRLSVGSIIPAEGVV